MVRCPTDQFSLRFSVLHEDVLLQVFEELKEAKCLTSLSMTSKRLREASMPVLFAHCYQKLPYRATTQDIIPEILWPYIRCD